jgi:uncharacterized sulfatase
MKHYLKFLSITALIATTAAAGTRPNFIFIMLDDFGIGQFAPSAQNLTPADMDPEFVEYVKNMPSHIYPVEDAIQAAKISMPKMLELSQESLFFNRAYAASALCAPSRLGFATGRHPNRFGVYENADINAFDPFLNKNDILASRLQSAGYATAQIGKWHLGPLDESVAEAVFRRLGLPDDTRPGQLNRQSAEYQALEQSGYFGSVPQALNPLNVGFDYYFGYNYHQSRFYNEWNVWENFTPAGFQKEYNTETFTDKAADFIRSALRQNKPFFVSLNYHAVHGPLFPSAPEHYMEHLEGFPHLLQNFFGHVRAVDAGVEQLIDLLREEGALENTIVIFTSDNGAPTTRENTLPGNAPYRGHKGHYVSGGIHVPLMIHWPQGLRQTGKTDALVSLMDIMPTLLDAAGLPLPEDLDGRSLLPLLSGKDPSGHDFLVWLGLESRTWGFLRYRAVMENFYQMRPHEPGSWTFLNERYIIRFTGAVPGKLYTDFIDGREPRIELYDLQNDPGEKVNLAGKYPELENTFRRLVATHSAELPPPNRWSRAKWNELINSLKE